MADQATYTVQSGDNLGRIAKKFKTTWQVLQNLNNLANPNAIFPGQILKLPGQVSTEHVTEIRPSSDVGAVAPIKTQLPISGIGFVTYNPDDAAGSDRYGTQAFVDGLIALAAKWAETSSVPISFGDMCHKNGTPFPPHAGHRTGREVDIRPFRTDGKNLPQRWDSPAYDRATTTKLVKLIRKTFPNARVFFNDPALIDEMLTRRLGGHDNHLHLQIYNP